jgi:predicted ATPase
MDRIKRVIIKNVRAIEAMELELSGDITVLIGENGAGKSTIIECLEILRKAAEPGFMQQLYTLHRGMPGLLRKGATSLTLGVVVADDAGLSPDLSYMFTLEARGAGAVVADEELDYLVNEKWSMLLLRQDVFYRDDNQYFHEGAGDFITLPSAANKPDVLALGMLGDSAESGAVRRMVAALRGIEVQLGFETQASWAARSYQRVESLRGASVIYPAERLSLLGVNLANVWMELRGRESKRWDEIMGLVRLGLGERVDSVVVNPDNGGGNIYLALRFTDLVEPVPAANLSDGQLAWLAFVGMTQLHEGRSLLAIDEPEQHMHPALLGRVIDLLSRGTAAPTLISTHSDRVLELLERPADALRSCSLEGSRAVLSRVDEQELPRWLEQFGDVGQLRASGYLRKALRVEEG